MGDRWKKIKERVGNGEIRAITDDPKLASKKSRNIVRSLLLSVQTQKTKPFINKIVEPFLVLKWHFFWGNYCLVF